MDIQARLIKRSITSLTTTPVPTIDVVGMATLLIDISNTFVGTVIFEFNNGSGWKTLTASIPNTTTTATGANAPGYWKVDVTGMQLVRVRPTAFTSGSIDIILRSVISSSDSNISTFGSVRSQKGRQSTTITSSTAETTIVSAVAGTFLDVYRIVLANTSATPCLVTIKDATAGTVVDTIEVPANGTAGWSGPESAAANQSVVNNNWTATCGTSVASIYVTAYYVKN